LLIDHALGWVSGASVGLIAAEIVAEGRTRVRKSWSCGLLVVDGCEVADAGVSSPRVVPGFDPFEDRQGELAAAPPLVPVEELELECAEEALGEPDCPVPGR
jgi:hypothetical protein